MSLLHRFLSTTCLTVAMAAAFGVGSGENLAMANPQDGVVVGGAANIISNGNKLDIIQTTDRAVINWNKFDIAPDEHTQFYQPNSSSIILNRINSTTSSTIAGQLTANGNVILVNPNGILFSKTATVDVNGLVATTADIDDQDFMNGGLNFNKAGNPNATIENQGLITAKESGLVGLVAPNVINSGVINAKLGRAQLSSGDSVTVDFYGDGLLEVKASDVLTSQTVTNTGVINAAGGTIAMTAAAARYTVNSVVKVSGELHAPSVGVRNGKIIIGAAGSNAVAGNKSTDKGKKTGVSTVLVDGVLDVRGNNPRETGGAITITADHIGILDGAKIDASGYNGGGTIHIGGDYLGQGETPAALVTIIQSGVDIKANALGSGNGGEVVVYSDNRTEFSGSIEAMGAGDDGNGGFTETSGKGNLLAMGTVRLTAGRRGKAGTWLMDPADITITASTDTSNTGNPNFTATATASQVSAASIKTNLDAGTNVTITTSNDAYTGNGDIIVSSAISTTGAGSLTLSAYRNITISSAITLQGGSLLLRADNAANGSGSIYVNAGGNLTTNGGNITMGGGSGGITAGSGYAVGNSAQVNGVSISANVNAGGGNIIINGQGGNLSTDSNHGVYVNVGAIVQTSAAGNITFNGIGGGNTASATNNGILITNASTVRTTGTGSLTLVGTGGNASGSGSGNRGIYVANSSVITATGGGAINITGTGSTSSGGSSLGFFLNGASITGSGGAINITGNGGASSANGNHGVQLITSGTSITNTGSGDLTITATAAGSGSSGGNYGFYMSGSNTVSTVNGLLTINGYGGHGGTTGASAGVLLSAFSGSSNYIQTTGTGNIVINGVGNQDGSASNGGNSGFNMSGTVASIVQTTGTGNILITGSSNTTGATGVNHGVSVGSIHSIKATGSGSISVSGTGSSSIGSNQIGVSFAGTISANGGNISVTGQGGGSTTSYGISLNAATITNAGSGTVSLTGIGGGSNSSNHGIYIYGGSTISSVDGALNVMGTGGGSGTGTTNYGVYITGASSTVKTTGTGALNVTGTGGNNAGTGGTNYGIYSSVANGIQTTGSGSIILKGVKGGQSTSYGIFGDLASEYITTGTGNITVYTDTISLAAASNINSAGILTIAPYTNGTMGVGYSTGYTLNLDNTTLGYINGASYVFGATTVGNGATNTSDMAINTTNDFVDKNVTFISGNNINLISTLTKATGAGTVAYLLQANKDIFNSNNSGIVATTGLINVTLQSDYDGNSDGAIYLAGGSISTNGGNITIGGGSGTITAGSGYAFGNSTRSAGAYISSILTAAGGNIIVNATSALSAVNNAYGIQTYGLFSTTGAGTISLNGISRGASNASYGYGLFIQAGVTTVNGNISLIGAGGGAGTGSDNYGVVFSSVGGFAKTTGTGNLIVTGTGGAGSGGYQIGVLTHFTNSMQTTGTGTITVNGTGGSSTGVGNYGVAIGFNAVGTISSAGGAITINGTGGGGTGNSNIGICVGGAFSGSITNTGTGTITLNGTGVGTGNSGWSYGVLVSNTSTLSAVNGNINVVGAGGGAGTGISNYGVYVSGGSIQTTGTGNVNITGTGGNNAGTGGANYGIYSSVANGIQTTGSGSITLKGVKGGQSTSYGVFGNLANGYITTGTGNITVYTDTISLATANNINSAGILTIAPYTNGTMGVGYSTGYTLSLDNTTLSYINGASYVFGATTVGNGSASTSDLTVGTTKDFAEKNVTFISGQDINLASTLTKATGTIRPTYLFQAYRNIYNSNSAGISATVGTLNVLLQSDYDGNNDGAVNLSGGTISTNGGHITIGGGSSVIFAGSGYAVGNATYAAGVTINTGLSAAGGNIIINGKGANISTNTNNGVSFVGAIVNTTGTGTITVNGIGQGTINSGSSSGVSLAGGTVLSTVNGNLTLVGQGGGAGSGASNSGVVISNGGTQVRTTGTGSLSISGTGGNGAGTGANNYGVYVTTGSSGLAATGTGSITVTGTGGNSSGSNNIGAWVSYVTAAGGAITLNGTGGTGAGSTNVGLYLDGTITNTGAGTITLTGTGGGTASGNGSSNTGVRLLGGSNFTTVNGAFNITGTGGGAGTGIGNYGVYVSGTVNAKTTGTGSLTVTGTGGNAAGTGGSNHGIYSSVANGLQTTGSGSLTLKGIKGGQATSYGIYGDLANEYNTTGTGNLSAYADTISLSAVNTINSAGVLTIAPYTNGTMGVGYSTGYTLNLNNTTLGYINGASYVFGALVTGNGATSTSNLTVGTTKDFADKNVTFISGQDINLATTLTKATGTGTANYIFRANRNIYNSSNAGVSATAGAINLTLQSDYDSNDDGAILLNGGSISTNGGNITIGGGSAAITAGSGYAVGNATYASGVNIGTFAAAGTSLSAAGGNIIVNGKGFNTTTDSNHGISVNTSITTTGSGTITLNGIAQGTSTSATNQGVVISGTTTISTVNGDLTLIGTSASSSGANNYGISVGGSGTKTIQTTGAGNLIINGTSLSTGVNGRGVSIAGNYNATGTGDIIITGVGAAASTQNNNVGIYSSAAVINSGAGKLTVTGTGGGAGASQNNHGVAAVGTFQTVNGLLTVTGFGGNATGTGNQNDGVSISTANGISTTGTGSIIVNAVKGSGTGGGTGLISTLSNSLVTTGTGNITVYTDSISFTVANSINSAGVLTLATYTNIGMSIGSNVASTFNISNTALGYINGASYVFGATTAGNGSASTSDLTVNTTKDFVDKNVTFISGNDINLAGTLTKATGAGTATHLFKANRNIYNSNSAGISATTGLINLTLQSDYDGNSAGAVNLSGGTIATNGGNITIGGGSGTITAGSGYAYGNSTYAYGVVLNNNISANGGNILVNGRGYDNYATSNHSGIYSGGTNAIVTNGLGTITFYGVGGLAYDHNAGVEIVNGAYLQVSNGAMVINGSSPNSTTGAGGHGVALYGGSLLSNGSGNITITGTRVASIGSALYVGSTGNVIGGASATGNINLNINDISWNVLNIQTTGTITIAPTTSNWTMGLGTGTGSLSLSTANLNKLNGGAYIFGSATTGNIDINTTRDFVDKNVTFISGGNIGLSGTLTKATGAGTATYLMQANGNITNSNSAGVSATTGLINLTMTSDNDVSGAGNIALTSAPLTVNGGAIILNSNGQSVTQSGTIGGDETINSLNGAVSIGILDGNTAGTRSLTVNAGTATYTTTGVIGGTNKLNNLSVTANDVVFGANIAGSGTLTLQPFSTNRVLNVNYGTADGTNFNLSTADISYLVNGWSSILVGRTNNSVSSSIGTSNWLDSVTFRSGWSSDIRGTITTSGTDSISFLNTYWNLQNGSNVTAGGNLNFSSGAVAYGYGTSTLASLNGNITFSSDLVNKGTTLTANNGTITFNSVSTAAGYNLSASAAQFIFGNTNWGSGYGSVSLTSTNSITLPSISAASIIALTTASTADLTIGTGRTLTASGPGNAITLVSGRNFINNSGSSTPLVLTGSGRYLIYSTNSVADALGGMSSGFVRYGCTYGGSCPSGVTIPASGNGSIYVVQPILTVTPNSINTVYGDAVPALAGYGYSVSGYLTGAAGADSDTNILTGSLTGTTNYVQGNDVGTYNLNYSSGTLTSNLGYAISYANNASGMNVAQRTLTASLTGVVSKTYDGTDVATLTSAHYSLGNVYGSDALTVTNTSGNYSDKNVGSGKNVSITGLTLSGTKASNYTFASSSVSGTVGTILQKALTLVGLGADNKVYDATTIATLNGMVGFSGIAGSDIVNLDGTGVGTFSDVNAGMGKAVTVTGYSISGTDANNYNFIQPTGIVADINKALLTVTANDQTIIYGTTVPTSTVTYTGFVGSENTNVLDTMATLSSANSGILNAGTYTGNYTISGAADNNYDFSYVTGSLDVLQRALTVTTADVDNLSGTNTPVFTGSNNLLAADSLLVTWVYAPIGYNVGDAGMYIIGATANDPSGRLANYVRTNNYGVYNVGVPPLPPTPTISAVPSQVISSLSVNVPISTFVILDIPVYNSNGEVVSTKKEWVDTSNLSNGNQPQTSNDFMLSYSDDLKRFLAAY